MQDMPGSSEWMRKTLGWEPTAPGMIEDLANEVLTMSVGLLWWTECEVRVVPGPVMFASSAIMATHPNFRYQPIAAPEESSIEHRCR
jgi:hypothetical protein